MKKLLTIIPAACCLIAARADEAPKRKVDEAVAVGMQLQPLGHGLWVSGDHQYQPGGWSEHWCCVGYRQDLEGGGSKIVPIIHLPALTNDSYEIAVEGRQLIVSSRMRKEELFRIGLDHIRVPKVQEDDPFSKTSGIRIDTKSVEAGSGDEELSFDWIVPQLSSKETEADQAGAGNPATRSGPDSEGGGKPQAKAEDAPDGGRRSSDVQSRAKP